MEFTFKAKTLQARVVLGEAQYQGEVRLEYGVLNLEEDEDNRLPLQRRIIEHSSDSATVSICNRSRKPITTVRFSSNDEAHEWAEKMRHCSEWEIGDYYNLTGTRLGVGGFGVVEAAAHITTGTPVAIKKTTSAILSRDKSESSEHSSSS